MKRWISPPSKAPVAACKHNIAILFGWRERDAGIHRQHLYYCAFIPPREGYRATSAQPNDCGSPF